mmetsp:Transcript_16934/g.33040  ORF Transcript_16934/g.33040 Transcript_16934/m.33040 type:complete len:133 (-) Transcript_16934:61-459(-)
MGGIVYHFGKPNPRHFLACLDNIGISYNSELQTIPGVAHVGDSLEHDVAGANAAGIDSVFVVGGIHAKTLGLLPTSSEKDSEIKIVDDSEYHLFSESERMSVISKSKLTERLQLLFKETGIWPTHVIPSLSL